MLTESLIVYCFTRAFIYQSLASLFTLIGIRLFLFFRTRMKRFALMKEFGIPVPELSIMNGNFHHYKANCAYFKVDMEFAKKFGKYYGFFIGDEPNIIVTDKNMLKKIFLESSESFKERTNWFLESPLTSGILFAKHNRWKFMREVMSPPFSMFTLRGESSTQFIDVTIKLMIDYIELKCKEARQIGERARFDIHSLMKSTALHLISSLAVKMPNLQVKENEPHVESLDAYLEVAVGGLVEYVIKLPLLKPLIQFLASHFEYDNTLSRIHKSLNIMIEKYKKTDSANIVPSNRRQNSNLMETMMNLHLVGKLTREELIANVDSLLVAGYDTTSTTLTYIFWTLGKHISVQERLRQDLMAYGLDSGYLMQVIKEVMRVYPTFISFTTRMATKNVQIDDLTIPEGCKVVYNGWLMHRHPDYWPEPEKFDPDRFSRSADIDPCAYAPFGFAERHCLGYHLALIEMKMFICDILLKYRLITLEPEELELKSHAHFLTEPLNKVYMEFQKILS